MERLLEKSLDDQYAIERERKTVENVLNRRLLWVMLPLGIAMAIAAYYIDISTRIAVPVLTELQQNEPIAGPRPEYDVFRLNLSAFVRLAPSAVIAAIPAIWFAVFAGTYYRRQIIAPMYALIGLIYALVFTALLGFLIPLNVWIINKYWNPITDSEIPFSDEITSFGNAPNMFPFTHLVTGMERGLWAATALIVLALVGMRLAGGLARAGGFVRSVGVSWVIAVVVVAMLLFGPIGMHQFLFDRFVQVPS